MGSYSSGGVPDSSIFLFVSPMIFECATPTLSHVSIGEFSKKKMMKGFDSI